MKTLPVLAPHFWLYNVSVVKVAESRENKEKATTHQGIEERGIKILNLRKREMTSILKKQIIQIVACP